MQRATANRLFGPLLRVGPATRLAWGGVAVVCLLVLGVARYLEPDARGYGTHQQLPFYRYPCGLVLTSGLPCPTCGMTTSFSCVMHGDLVSAFKAQPAGAVLCVGAIALLGFAFYVVFSGRILLVNWDRVGPVRLMLGLGFLILGGWAFKIVHGLTTGALPVR